MGVHVRPRVLGLAVLQEHIGRDLVDLGDELEERVLGQVLQSELTLAFVAWVGLAQYGVAVAWQYSALAERLPDEVLHLLIGRVLTDLLDRLLDPNQHLLVGEAVEWTGEAVHGGGIGQVGIGEGTAHQMASVGAHVAALVVTVDGQVEAHELGEVVVGVAEHVGEVGGPVLFDVDGAHAGAIAVQVPVDDGGDGGQLGDEVHGVLVDVLPVLGLVHALRVRLGELGLALQGVDRRAQL